MGGLSNNTRGIWAGGYTGSAEFTTMDYVTIATAGNASNFGTLYQTVFSYGGGAGSTTRGIWAGGAYNGGGNYWNGMQYVTIATAGNASYFGNISGNVAGLGACCSSGTRFLSAGGTNTNGTNRNEIDYVTIASTGNYTTFGTLTVSRTYACATSNGTRGLFVGGHDGGTWSPYNVIDYVTIASTGNATDFGDLTQARGQGTVGASTCHGGI
jgi:hypothetical protein